MIKLKVNGKNHQFKGDPDMPLRHVPACASRYS